MHRRVYDLDRGCFADEKPKKVRWRMWQDIQIGCLMPLKAIENKVRTFCWKHGLSCEILKSGWLVKDVRFLVSGESSEQDAKDYAESLRKWFLDLERL